MPFDLRRLIPAELRADPGDPAYRGPAPRGPAPRGPAYRGGAGFWFFAGHLLTIWGLALSNAFLGLTMLWSLRRRRPLDWPRTSAVLAPLGIYAICFVVSILFSLEPRTSLGELRDLLTLATLPLALLWVRGERDVRRLVDLLLLVMVVLALYGIVQYHTTDYGPLQNRIRGPFSHYMTFAGVLLLGDFLLLGRMLVGDGWKRPWHWVALASLNTALLLSLTRGAWVAAGVTVAVALAVRARRAIALYLAAVVLAGVLFVALAPDAWNG